MIRHEIERHLVQPQEMEIVLYLDPMLYWFNGHFAVQPLLPGVAQLDWVMHYATTLLAPGWRFRSIQNVKFLAPLIPFLLYTSDAPDEPPCLAPGGCCTFKKKIIQT
ncbi:hypothetical protein ACI1VO_24085 [Escherichia coli]|uniref:ApeI family dehydratase n=1 Tax=Escherichia coli TaxID=562 RepID=UPI00384C71D0